MDLAIIGSLAPAFFLWLAYVARLREPTKALRDRS